MYNICPRICATVDTIDTSKVCFAWAMVDQSKGFCRIRLERVNNLFSDKLIASITSQNSYSTTNKNSTQSILCTDQLYLDKRKHSILFLTLASQSRHEQDVKVCQRVSRGFYLHLGLMDINESRSKQLQFLLHESSSGQKVVSLVKTRLYLPIVCSDR